MSNLPMSQEEGAQLISESLRLAWIEIDDLKREINEIKSGQKIVFISNEDYKNKLIAVKGIAEKTALDIMRVYPTEESLKKAIDNGENLPVRDDIERKLKETWMI